MFNLCLLLSFGSSVLLPVFPVVLVAWQVSVCLRSGLVYLAIRESFGSACPVLLHVAFTFLLWLPLPWGLVGAFRVTLSFCLLNAQLQPWLWLRRVLLATCALVLLCRLQADTVRYPSSCKTSTMRYFVGWCCGFLVFLYPPFKSTLQCDVRSFASTSWRASSFVILWLREYAVQIASKQCTSCLRLSFLLDLIESSLSAPAHEPHSVPRVCHALYVISVVGFIPFILYMIRRTVSRHFYYPQ